MIVHLYGYIRKDINNGQERMLGCVLDLKAIGIE